MAPSAAQLIRALVVVVVVGVDNEPCGILPSSFKAPIGNCCPKDLAAFVNADETRTRFGSGEESLEKMEDFGGGFRLVEESPSKSNTTGEAGSLSAIVASRAKKVLSLCCTILLVFRCRLVVCLDLSSTTRILPRKRLVGPGHKTAYAREVAPAMRILVSLPIILMLGTSPCALLTAVWAMVNTAPATMLLNVQVTKGLASRIRQSVQAVKEGTVLR
jgi:hypothetical protein